jgi:hypothetical protein
MPEVGKVIAKNVPIMGHSVTALWDIHIYTQVKREFV